MLNANIKAAGDTYKITIRCPHVCSKTFPLTMPVGEVNAAAAKWEKATRKAVKVVAPGLWRIARHAVKGLQYYARHGKRETRFWLADDHAARAHFLDWAKGTLLQEKHGVRSTKFSALHAEWIKDQSASAQRTLGAMSKRVLDHFGDWDVADITTPDVHTFVDTKCVKADGTPLAATSVRNTIMPNISRPLAIAARRGIIPANPAARLDLDYKDGRPKLPRKKGLTKKELVACLAKLEELHPDLAVLAKIQAGIGLRFGEASALQLADFYVDEDGVRRVKVLRHFLDEGTLVQGSKTGDKDAHRYLVGAVVPTRLWEQVIQPQVKRLQLRQDPCFTDQGWLFSHVDLRYVTKPVRDRRGYAIDNTPAPGIDYKQAARTLKKALPENQANVTHAFRNAYSDLMRGKVGVAQVAEQMGHSVPENEKSYQTKTLAEEQAEASAADVLLFGRKKR